MPSLRAVFGECKDFGAFFGHENGVLELRRKFSVARANSPIVASVELRESRPGIHHRLDRKAQTWQQTFLPRFSIGYMWNIRVLMETLSKTMSDILADNGKSATMGFPDDRIANIADRATRRKALDRQMEAIESGLRDRSRFIGALAD